MPSLTHTKRKSKVQKQVDNGLRPLEFLPVNRNLRHWPIARSERIKMRWRRRTKGGYRYYRLPDAEIRLPLDCSLPKRHATGFDVAVLLTLTGLAKARKKTEIRVANRDILICLGLNPNSGYNLNKVAKALMFWQHATIVWPNWYMSTVGKTELVIERPIENIGRGWIRISKHWLTTAASDFYIMVPAPLPTEAVVQNLCLLVLGWRKASIFDNVDGKDIIIKSFRSRRQITRRIGLDHHERNLQLTLAFEKLEWWFEKHGGRLRVIEYDNGNIELILYLPPIEVPLTKVKRKHRRTYRRKAWYPILLG